MTEINQLAILLNEENLTKVLALGPDVLKSRLLLISLAKLREFKPVVREWTTDDTNAKVIKSRMNLFKIIDELCDNHQTEYPNEERRMNLNSQIITNQPLSANDKDLRKATREAIPIFNDERDINKLNEFIHAMELYIELTNYDDEQTIIFLKTKVGPDHRDLLREKIISNEEMGKEFTWKDWVKWMRRREIFRNDDDKA